MAKLIKTGESKLKAINNKIISIGVQPRTSDMSKIALSTNLCLPKHFVGPLCHQPK